MRKRLVWILSILVVTILTVAGCNTIKGVGTDITEIAQASQDVLDSTFSSIE